MRRERHGRATRAPVLKALNTRMSHISKIFKNILATFGLITIVLILFRYFLIAFTSAGSHIGGHGYTSNETKAMSDMHILGKQAELFLIDNGRLPNKISELVDGYLKSVPMDPWGNKYQMKIEEGKIILFTFNPSKTQGKYLVR